MNGLFMSPGIPSAGFPRLPREWLASHTPLSFYEAIQGSPVAPLNLAAILGFPTGFAAPAIRRLMKWQK